MDKATFEAADSHIEKVAEDIAELLEGEYFEAFDSEREQSLPLLRTSLASTNGSEPILTWGDSSPQKYIVNGDMMIVPHDHCPSCWGQWDFKFRHTTCVDCGARLGVEVKVLLDTDRCPSCEKETVSPTELTCRDCRFEIDPSWVVWGYPVTTPYGHYIRRSPESNL